jgi:hypothetical protein
MFKRAGKSVKRTAKKVGKQVKRSAAVAAPAMLGPGLGEKVGLGIARTAGKTAEKSVLRHMAQVSKVTGKTVQVAGTVVATWFGGPAAGAGAYKLTGAASQFGLANIRRAQYRKGFTNTVPTGYKYGDLGLGLAGAGATFLAGGGGSMIGGALGGGFGGDVGDAFGDLASPFAGLGSAPAGYTGPSGDPGASGAGGDYSTGSDQWVWYAAAGALLLIGFLYVKG